ncbi:helix-turn-helix domain-containing protein [Sphingomonas sp. OK281]|uniref:helix-turn-helix domain-containing protein n=1 Tax=Sphingomonas sp. OK281 TaxID=1881067 RepID=UPI0008F0CE14|nr:AraC family transcriptional regulator [Sphingomonas sp. OK281]SFN71716.1 transcriptional regulator, AraC family [Sphingomonas sp. OK281]
MLHTAPGATALPRAFAPSVAASLLANAVSTLDHNPHVARHYLERLAAMFVEDDLPPIETTAPAKGGLAAWQLRGVVQHIERALGSTIGVDALAEVARLSTGHFCRAFKVTTGETPHAFLIRQRVHRAQTLMLRTDETLSRIAYACGLTDQAHLTRLFRRVVGVTPFVWRRTWQQPPSRILPLGDRP